MTTRLASCTCGRITATVEGDPLRVSVCHCLACQRRTGGVFASQARFARSQVRISGQGLEFTRVGDEGPGATFTFCPTCGDTVHYRMVGDDEFVIIPVGAFADPSFPAPEISVYEERMHSWVVMPEGIQHFR